MKNPIRAYEFLKTFDSDTIIRVKQPPPGLPDELRAWEDEELYRRVILSADIGIYKGKVVVGVYVSTDDAGPTLFPCS